MAMTERIVFMPYVWRLRGKKKVLEPGTPVLCRSESDALRWVEKLETGALTAAGGQAVKMLVDEMAGDYGEPTLLASAGTVPALADA